MDSAVFYLSGILSVTAAVLVVTRRNPVYSTVLLVLFFSMISLDFLVLRAPFLAVVQMLVYAGAIMVLFLFVIMLLNLTPEELRENVPRRRKILAGAMAFLVFGLLATAVWRSPTVQNAPSLVGPVAPGRLADAGETAAIGEALFTTHALAFELSSILILIAIVGAIYLTKKRRKQGARGEPTGLEATQAAAPALSLAGHEGGG